MKKLICILILAAMLLSCAACSAHDNAVNDTSADTTATSETTTTTSETTTAAPSDDISTPDTVITVFPSIFPDAWKSMNAVIVKWGKQNGEKWHDSSAYWENGVSHPYKINYIGVDVELVKVFDETMEKSNYTDFYGNMPNVTSLMLPEQYIEHAREGEMSLVFLDLIYTLSGQLEGGGYLTTRRLGVRLGVRIAEGEFSEPPIFAIEDGKIQVPDRAYLTRSGEDDSNYFTQEIYYLAEANKHIQKSGAEMQLFENGMPMEILDEYFNLICNLIQNPDT